MYLDSESIRQSQRSMGRMPLTVYLDDRRLVLCWVRLIEGRSERLLTACTRHTVHEIEYALRCPLTIRIGERDVRIAEGEFLIVPPETPHQITESAPDGVKFILGFSAGDALPPVLCTPVPDTPVIRGIVETLSAALRSGSRDLQHALMQSALLAFLDAVPRDAPPPETHDHREQCVKRFLAFVESSNGVGISVQEGARLVSLSERQLFRHCLALTGFTPSAIIHRARAAYIRSCLTETRLSLSEIAVLAGFQTEYAMAKFFRKAEGMLPSACRRQSAACEK